MTQALIFNVQRFSTEDGPGIRSTVFFKGCPLRCRWCHNPEGLLQRSELVWFDTRCIAHRACETACPSHALQLTPNGMRIDRERCDACGACADVCPSGALEIIGRRLSAPALFEEILQDAVFFETSGGGVTLSGGEPMMQARFLAELLPLCKRSAIHVALDTCGLAPWSHYEMLLPFIDLVLFDLKVMDSQRHLSLTGAPNEVVLDTADRLAQSGVPMWIRTPIVPGLTDDIEQIRAMGAFIRDTMKSVERWELLAYTNLGKPKYPRFGLDYTLAHTPPMQRADMERLHAAAENEFSQVSWSGATAFDGASAGEQEEDSHEHAQ